MNTVDKAYNAYEQWAEAHEVASVKEAFFAGFRAAWREKGITRSDINAWLRVRDYELITREELARLQRKAGEGPMMFS